MRTGITMTFDISTLIKTTQHSNILPRSKKEVLYRPYSVGDEKILVQATSVKDTDPDFYLHNISKVIQGCVLNDVDFKSLPAIDGTFLFILLKSASSGEEMEIRHSIKDKETGKVTSKKDYTINLDAIQLVESEDHKSVIDLGDGLGIKMKDISFATYSTYGSRISAVPEKSAEAEALSASMVYEMIYDSVDAVFDNENSWKVGEEITRDDVEKFINKLENSEPLYQYIATMPKLVISAVDDVTGEVIKLDSTDVDFLR